MGMHQPIDADSKKTIEVSLQSSTNDCCLLKNYVNTFNRVYQTDLTPTHIINKA